MLIPSVFVSYSHKDEIWKDRLKPHLRMLEQAGQLTIWDDRHIDAGATWYDEIKKAMEDAEVAVCLISADYLASDFCIKEEIPYLLERRKSNGMLLLPILIRPCAWTAIEWLKAIQMLPRDGKVVARDYKDDWDTPFTQVAERILSIPKGPALTRELPVDLESRWSLPEKVDVDRLPVTGKELFGRQNELKLLDEAWESGKNNVISFVAWGGVGKSTLINKWCEQLAADNYRGAKRVYSWSFYSQGTGERVTSADLFIAEALKWFGDTDPTEGSPWDKGQRLADLVRSKKTLLLLDGMEPLQSYLDFERGKIKDPALAVLVTELAKENSGLCVITTRESVIDLNDFSETVQQIDLEQISAEAGRALLRVGGVKGTDAELEQAANDFGLHALALNLLAAYIYEIPGHHISNASEIPDLDVPLKEGKHPRRVMLAFAKRFGDSAEVDLLRILGLFSSPANREEIESVRAAPSIPNLTEHIQAISEKEWLQLINRLRRLNLIAPESKHRTDALDAHPLVREHFGRQIKQEYLDAWREGNNRLYEYYKSAARELPNTIQEMAPLFAAVMHGCRAKRYQEAFWDYYKRVQRGGQVNYCYNHLGAIGADLAVLSNFFDPPWHKPVDELREDIRAGIQNFVGFRLRALGRLAEAVQLMQSALEASIALKQWDNAASSAHNISELHLIVGNVARATYYAHLGVELTNQSSSAFLRMSMHSILANALHQAGSFAEAETEFHQAEEIEKQRPEMVLSILVSIPGFQYCDLKLDQGKYLEVKSRASRTSKLAKQEFGFLSNALDYLSLGRAHLLQSQYEPSHSFAESATYLNRAMDGLRQAGTQDHLPRGLLARAEYYRLTGALDKAKRDLDEAFTVATRSRMGLHLADCHLEYARLNLAKGEKDEAQKNAKIAKEMIRKMGYHRRDKEVRELEEQLSSEVYDH
jgi:tetratricopeptide (TPR) repeat protein